MSTPTFINTPQGMELLSQSQVNLDFARYLRFYQTQINVTTCALASAAMVLNTLPIKAPLTPEYYPARQFTQMNLLNEAAQQVISYRTIQKEGVTLNQLKQLLTKAWPVTVESFSADSLNLPECRSLILKALNCEHQRIIANYDIKVIGLSEKNIGHFSPIAAYEPESDQFLILDVARYAIDPFWVTTSQLLKGMQTIDTLSSSKRGFLIMSSSSVKK